MPKIIITLTEEQLEKMNEHFAKGGQLELQEETLHGYGFSINSLFGCLYLEADSQAGKLDLGFVPQWEVVQ